MFNRKSTYRSIIFGSAAFMSAVALSGCTSQRALTSMPVAASVPKSHNGAIYYLPMSLVTFTVKGGVPEAPKAKTVQDSSARLLLSYAGHSSAYDDSLKVTLTGQSLLEEVDFSAEDKTAGIIANAVATIAESLKAASGIPSFTPKGIANAFNYQGDFDPFDPKQVAAVNKALLPGNLRISIPELPAAPAASSQSADCGGSLCFRTHRTIIIVVENLDKGIWSELARNSVEVVDKTTLGTIDVERLSLVKAQTKIEFTDGVLKKIDMTRPSQGLAASAIPLNVIKQIVAIPNDLVQFKIDTSGKYEALYKQQQATLDQQQKLIDKLTEAAKKKPSDGNDPAGMK